MTATAERVVVAGGTLRAETASAHPTTGALADDEWTCRSLLSLAQQRRRGVLWGNVCRTVNRLPAGGDLVCAFCGQAS